MNLATIHISFLLICIASLIDAQDLSFDEEGNVISPTRPSAAPFNFHKLVASKVKGEETSPIKATTGPPEQHSQSVSSTEDAKKELRLLKGLYRRLLESKETKEKEKLRGQIMEKVEIIETILHKKNKTKITEEGVDYFTEEKNLEVESPPEEQKEITTMQPLFEFDDITSVSNRSKKKLKGVISSSTTSENTEATTTGSTTSKAIKTPATELEEVELERTYYPWESPQCKDEEEKDTCQSFKHMCTLLPVIAYRRCRKTCKLCMEDTPPARSKSSTNFSLKTNVPFSSTSFKSNIECVVCQCINHIDTD